MASNDTELVRLLEGYFDGRLTAEERTALEQRLRDDPAARQAYWEQAHWHAALSAWGEQDAGRQAAKLESFPAMPRPRSRRIGWWGGALAAAAAIAVIFAVLRLQPVDVAEPLAQVSFQRETGWAREMAAGEYSLDHGTVRFETAAGASVSVAGPARFRLVAADRIELASGQLTARMLHADAKLTVKVRDLEVTDLGTAFGIDASDTGRALVSVFDGLVAVTSTGVAGEMRLAQGESLIHEAGALRSTERTDYNAAAFRELWPLTAGIDEASHLVEFLPPGPLLRPLREYRANDRVFLFPEQQRAVVQMPLSVDLSPDVREWPESPVSPYPIARDEPVSSYLIFFQPDPAAPGGVRRLSGEITFQHRIVGVICSDEGLDASDPVVGAADADYSTPGQRRGFEEADKENYRSATLPHDQITIGNDGRTVRFDLYVSNEREQMRVLVDPR